METPRLADHIPETDLDKFARALGLERTEPSPASFTFATAGDAVTAAQILSQFDELEPAARRLAFGRAFGMDPDKIAIVRNGHTLEVRELSAQSAQAMKRLSAQGMVAATFTNRKQRRAAKAKARQAHASRSR